MAMCEEAYKRRRLRAGKTYNGKLPVRGDSALTPSLCVSQR